MSDQITHQMDPDTGHMRQIVPPHVLRAILDADGDSYERPADFGPDDEWDTGTRDHCPKCGAESGDEGHSNYQHGANCECGGGCDACHDDLLDAPEGN